MLIEGIEDYTHQKVHHAYLKFQQALDIDRDSPKHLYKLANMYFKKGHNLRGIFCLKISMEQGCINAAVDLGLRYFNGDKVPKNMEKAKECFEKFAKTNPRCQYHLAAAILKLKPNDSEKRRAFKLIEKAADGGYQRAKDVLSELSPGRNL